MYHKVVSDRKTFVGWIKEILPMLNWANHYIITIKVFRKKRSIDQNSLYWMWMTAIANHIGDTKEAVHNAYIDEYGITKEVVHEAFKRKYLPWTEVVLPGGLDYWNPGRTPEQDTKEFNDYMEKVRKHAMDFLEIYLPYPNDEGFDEFVDIYNVIGMAMK